GAVDPPRDHFILIARTRTNVRQPLQPERECRQDTGGAPARPFAEAQKDNRGECHGPGERQTAEALRTHDWDAQLVTRHRYADATLGTHKDRRTFRRLDRISMRSTCRPSLLRGGHSLVDKLFLLLACESPQLPLRASAQRSRPTCAAGLVAALLL